jgi:hypothetical protein
MNKTIRVLCAIGLSAFSFQASATVNCTLSGFRIDAYHHAGTYLHGFLNGVWINYLSICGETAGAQDCASKATDRRLALALTAQAQGKNLTLEFWNQTACSQVVPYTIVVSVQVQP